MAKNNNQDQPQSLKEAWQSGLEHAQSQNVQMALLLGLVIAGLSVVAVNFFGGAQQFRELIENAGVFAPLVFVGLKSSTYVIAPLSGTPVRLAGGALFGFWEGAFLVLIGDLLGASLNFWIGRLLRAKTIAKFFGQSTLTKIDDATQHVGGWRALLVGRLLLSSLYDFIAYAAGLSNLKFKHFFWVTLLGGIPSTLFAAWVGDALVVNQAVILPVMAVVALAILASLYFNRRPASEATENQK